MSIPQEGKPARSAETIRSALDSIHKTAGVERQIGPVANGLQSADQLCIASFHNREVARSFQQLLSQTGIFSTLVNNRNVVSITVDYEDRERAGQLYDEHRETCPDGYPKGKSKRYDYLIFGLAIGLSFGAILFAGAWSHRLAIVIPLTFGAIGASSGHLIDCLRMRYYQTGRIRIGVWEFLVLSTLPALVTFAWRFLPDILRD